MAGQDAGKLQSRTEGGLPDADAKLQEACPGIIFIIDPKYKNKYLQRSYGFSIFISL